MLDAAPTNKCPGRTRQKSPFVSAACQSALEEECCAELVACYVIGPPGASDDCDKYATCSFRCNFTADGINDCRLACDLATTRNVLNAFDDVVACSIGRPKSKVACR